MVETQAEPSAQDCQKPASTVLSESGLKASSGGEEQIPGLRTKNSMLSEGLESAGNSEAQWRLLTYSWGFGASILSEIS